MSEARYDPVADFYATAFNAVDDPAAAALLDLTGAGPACGSWTWPAGTAGSPGSFPGAGPT